MPLVRIPPPYRGPTGGEGQIQVEGRTVGDCLDAVDARYPGFASQVFDADRTVHRFVRFFVNGDAIERSALGYPVGEEDEVEVLAAIAGG